MHVEFNSTAVKSARYNPLERKLWVTLPKASYIYTDVPAEVFEGLCKADSAGKFYNMFIRGKFQ